MRWQPLCAAVLCIACGPVWPAGPQAPPVPAPALAQAEDEEDIPQGGRPVTPEMERKVRAFLERFIDADKTPEEQAALFTERADYYDQGYVGRDEIRRDVERYMRHWPERHYELETISYMSADPESDRVFVSYTLGYRVARGDRSARGKASYGVVIFGLNSDPMVESIREKVAGRKPASNE